MSKERFISEVEREQGDKLWEIDRDFQQEVAEVLERYVKRFTKEAGKVADLNRSYMEGRVEDNLRDATSTVLEGFNVNR